MSATDTTEHSNSGRPSDETTVTVTFPASKKGAHRGEFGPHATVGEARAAAMLHFEVSDDDPQFVYYLSANRQRQEDSTLVRDVAGHDHQVTFRLVKDLRQG